jgi:hypothetical protein
MSALFQDPHTFQILRFNRRHQWHLLLISLVEVPLRAVEDGEGNNLMLNALRALPLYGPREQVKAWEKVTQFVDTGPIQRIPSSV